ncbi:EpsG family protein [Parapedobacter defluvii]|uniref:EpsG family protein n=1 Tax=Parapedobacter defluvii TaxID=2045106 RepID=UPI00166AD38D
MIIYIVVFILLSLLTILDLVKVDLLYKKILFATVLILLIVISGVRWDTGPDWDSYHNFYDDIEHFVHSSTLNFFEPGFTYLNLFSTRLGLNYTSFLFFVAVITIGLKGLVFSRNHSVLFVLLFLYYCYYLADIFSVRQFTAVSICLFGLKYIEYRRFLPFLCCILLAASIHISAVFFLLAYWFYRFKLTNAALYTLLIVGFTVGLIGVSGWAIKLVVNIIGVDAATAEKLLLYGDEGLETSHTNPYLSYTLGVLKRTFILPLLIYGQCYISTDILPRYLGYLNLLVFGNMIYFIFILSVPVITRLALPFLYMEIFLLSYLLISLNDFKLKIFFFILVLIFGAFRLYLFMYPYWDLYVPFQTIFNKFYDLRR